jgi:hypothetical protein
VKTHQKTSTREASGQVQIQIPRINMSSISSSKAWVVMPLYYYPLTNTTWQPLYDACVTSIPCPVCQDLHPGGQVDRNLEVQVKVVPLFLSCSHISSHTVFVITTSPSPHPSELKGRGYCYGRKTIRLKPQSRRDPHGLTFKCPHGTYSIAAHPDTNFLIVVNPNSGPGDLPLPGPHYVQEVPRLNAFANVRCVGYVRIDYCRKPLRESMAEVRQYADWNTGFNIPGLHVHGIYVDETPNHVSQERSEYLDALRLYIKRVNGLLGERTVRD